MTADVLLVIAAAASVGGVAVLRLAWGQPRRSAMLNGLGWVLLLLSPILGWAAAGAWGSSMAALWGMGAAFVGLAGAALASRPSKALASNRRVGMLPEGREPLRITGRVLTFVLVTVLAAVLSFGAALAACLLGLSLGWSAANAYTAAFFVAPLAWTLIAYALLMQPARLGQYRVLALSSLPTWPVLALGLLS